MPLLSDDKLLIYNEKGLIPGPEEKEEDFLLRAEYCLHLRERLANQNLFDLETQPPVA